MKTLSELGRHYGTDKDCHGYLSYYDSMFTDIRGDDISFLEIGVFHGDSLRMWRDYFPCGMIYGIDSDPETMFSEDRIKTSCGSQINGDFLSAFAARCGRKFSVIIDDGSHVGEDQLASFEHLWPHVVPGGWYCIEDCYSLSLPRLAPEDSKTIFEVINGNKLEILTGQSSIREVRIVGNGPCDGLVMFRKGTAL